ncbi:uncharacterized protein Z520_08092 [Fonsecaea multimorphosa CBS 102226]|uniref:Uncharacterized protein n=1 Tax=Fonsecaea multimorphosa CBS 102226 TaxID=1442371 RepID=A0A0D2K0A4_9EURO|nr:uncharacterized protein Z520_08092 [Fonsecaea multimorphosa CBS 102226]KIX96314.1 hypothetical protein Z520_08092 [Fonsecaea multimorphosa CBS 102226]OAL21974.1 hypothetical protein AYO22_07571 [Fonsecaea multimorphosa]
MLTNIPKRAVSPIKPDSALLPDASSAATSGKAPQDIQLEAKEPTRLESGPASLRATRDASARLHYNPSKPRVSRVATKTSTTDAALRGGHLVRGHSRSQSSSNAITGRPTSSAPKLATATASSRSHHAPSTTSSGEPRWTIARSHNRALTASTRPKPNADPGANREVVSKVNRPVASHVLSEANASSSSAGPTVKLGRKPEANTHCNLKVQTTTSTATTPLFPLISQPAAVRSGSVGRVISGTEVAHLEDELLQLSLVHEKSAATFQNYRASVRSQLETGLQDVEQQLSTLTSLRHDRQANINAFAVSQWLDQERVYQDGDPAASDTLLLLAHCLEDLQKISSVHGPLEAAMKIFDEWYVYASSMRPTDAGDNLFRKGDGEENEYCLHSIDPHWSALVSSVDGRVRACAALLEGLRRPPSSSLGLLIEIHCKLAEQILQEIRICRTIEGLILREQQERLAREVKHALYDVELRDSVEGVRDTTRIGIWDLRGKAS